MLTTEPDESVKRIANLPGLLTALGGISGILIYLTRARVEARLKAADRINAQQERSFMRVASAAKGESVYTKALGDTLEAQRFLRQVERLIFDSGITIKQSVVEPGMPSSKWHRVVIDVPNLYRPPYVAKVLSRAFKSIGIDAPIVAKASDDYEKDTTVRIHNS
jgi:hypothetical protein